MDNAVATDEKHVLAAGPDGVGSKAWNLAHLVELGCRVPAFGAVTCDAFRAHLRRSQATARIGEALVAAADGADTTVLDHQAGLIRDALASVPLDAAVVDGVDAILRRTDGAACSVRSSMVGEDSATHSFAGQLDSFLYLTSTAEVHDALLDCWASAFGARMLVYAGRAGLALASARMGVIVQEMVDSEAAGVLFTANPSNGRRDECVVSAVWGQGEGAVSGRLDTDEYTWRRGTGEVAARVAHKPVQIVAAASGGGTADVAVAADRRDARCLDTATVARLCSTGLRVEESTGAPVDVEWAAAGGDIYLLQARPVTALPDPPADPAEAEVIWDNSNIQESYCGVTTPLTFSFASRAYAIVYETTFRMLGTPEQTLAEYADVFRNLLGLVRGRIYYNLSAWYRGCMLLPNVRHTKEDMEAMMGVDEPVDFVTDEDIGMLDRLRRVPHIVGTFARLAPQLARCDAHIAEFDERFARVVASIDRAALRDAALGDLVRTLAVLDTELLERWQAPILNDGRVLQSSGRLRRFISDHVPEDTIEAVLAGLLAGIDGIASVEPTRELLDIAGRIRDDPAAAAALATPGATEALRALATASPAIGASIDAYVDRFGDRVMGELKLETVTLRSDRSFLADVLRNYVARPDLTSATLVERERRHHEDTLQAVREQVPQRLHTRLQSRVDAVRHAVKMREHLRLARTILFGLYRDVYCAVGVRLREVGRLTNARDVFYLTDTELRAFAEGRAVTTDLDSLATLRRSEFDAYERLDLAHRFVTHGSPYVGNDLDPAPPPAAPGPEMRGTGCYPGVVDAPARVIFSPDDDLDVNGRILVTIRTDPGWAPLFPTCSGLLVERGSTLSHSAVVARELGIPAIVGIPHLTATIADGERVSMDGGSGIVRRDPGEAGPP